jgi:hypothetical protein
MQNDDAKPTAAEIAEAKALAERLQKLVGRSQ